jgi:O-acetyl-ADP-ribose deacetylase (regulator of RNase III)
MGLIDSSLFAAFPSFESYYDEPSLPYALLGLGSPALLERAAECVAASPDPEREVVALLADGWRMEMIGAVATIAGCSTPATIAALWEAFDAGSWAAPQLAATLGAVDPAAPKAMRKRLLLGCPITPRGKENLSPMERHVQHGSAALPTYSLKGWLSLCWRLSLEEEGMTWLLQRFSAEEALGRLLDPYAYEGCDIPNTWHQRLRVHRPDLGLPPSLDHPNSCRYLARRWCTREKLAALDCPARTLEALLQEFHNTVQVLEPLLRPGLERGDEHFEFRPEGVTSRSVTVPLSRGLRDHVLRAVYGSCPFSKSGRGLMRGRGSLPDLALDDSGPNLQVRLAPPLRVLEGRINLCRDRLENAGTEAVCYGAKDTGEMGGGAAIALSLTCGPELLADLRYRLAQTGREVGEVVITEAYDHPRASLVGHIISIKTSTPEGDWCPAPERLGDGVYRALQALQDQAQTVAFSCLATGEGRAQPGQVASLMLGATRRYFKDHPDSDMKVLFCLPSYRDYQAFERALAR